MLHCNGTIHNSKMNVLKADLMSKQKRLQNRRQKVLRSFFSGYHTVSDIVPSTDCIKLLPPNSIVARNKIRLSPKYSTKLSDSEKAVELKSFDIYSSDGKSYGNEISVRSHELLDQRDSTISTSLEFQKLLEPFLSFKQENLHDLSQELKEKNCVKRELGKCLQNSRILKEDCLDTFFQTQKLYSTEECFIWQKTPRQDKEKTQRQSLSNLNAESFEKYSIFNLSVPKNQKSIGDILRAESNAKGEISEDVIRTPIGVIRNFYSDLNTPRTKVKKTPKVSDTSKTMSSELGAFILAVTEGRGHARGEVGIAAMDPKRPHLVLCQISDTQRYIHSLTKMNLFDFVEVIVPNTFVDCSSPSKLYSDIRSAFPKIPLTSVQRRHFNESIGVDLIRQYCSLESTSVTVLLQDKFYALSAAAALIKYIEYTQNVRLAPHSLKIEYQGMEDAMIIDFNTANLLELVSCVNHSETNLKHNLLGVINYCHTKGGVRLLRANILQPLCSLTKIRARLDCVTELVNNPLLLCSLEAAVTSFSNLEDLLNLCMHSPQQEDIRVAEYQLKYTLLLKTILEHLPPLLVSLRDAKSQFFLEFRENLEDPRYSSMLNRILQTVFENAKTVKGSVAAHLHGCFAIKAGINSLLDIAKKTYCEIVQEISDHVTKLREKHNLSLRLAFSASKGFHIQYTLPPGQRSMTDNALPTEFIFAQKSKTKISFYTPRLVALDQRSQHVLNEIKLMTNVILFELLTDIRQYIGCIFNLCEYVAELDVLISFAHVGSGRNYVRPNFGDTLDLKDSRHPILDVLNDGEVVPNDVFAKPGKNFTILTGPNQSGKSIYIRQIALLQIMAQIGCYVPAREANFRLTDRIFSRIGFDDSLESNASTLIVEMRDIEYLKQNKTSRSLVVIDELCRGTSVDEGASLAFAICEELLDTSAFIFFTTHYLFLTKLEEMYFNVTNYHFESKIETTLKGTPSVQFTHLRKKGATKADSYGLQVARMTSLPKDVYSKAKEISVELSKDRKPCRVVKGLLAKYELSVHLKHQLIKLESEINTKEMASVIRSFQQLYVNLRGDENSSLINEKLQEGNENVFNQSSATQRKHSGVFSLPNLKSGKSNGILIPVKSLFMENKNNKEKHNKDLVLRLANMIRKKYKSLHLKKKTISRKIVNSNGWQKRT